MVEGATLLVVLCAYYLPTLMAVSKRAWTDSVVMFFLNTTLGWTVIGWLILLIMAFTIPTYRPPYIVIERMPKDE